MIASRVLRLFIIFLLAVLPKLAFGELFDPIAVYLTWQRSPESTMTIRWITHPNRLEDLVEYRQEGSEKWLRLTGSHAKLPRDTPYILHSIELTNLLPGTRYIFKTGSNGVFYKFQTMPAIADTPIRFVAGGDMYHDAIEIMRKTHVQAAMTAPHFALVGGDIAYAVHSKMNCLPHWCQSWIDQIAKQKFDRWLSWLITWKEDMVTPDGCLIPILPVIGNHDTDGRFDQTPSESPFFYALFAMPGPQGYNVLDFGNYMSVFLLDSGHTHPIGDQQTAWLAASLEQRSNVIHKFALYHVPAFPSVRKVENEYCSQVRKNWVPIFERYRLSAAFENHDHAYKRTHPMLAGKIDGKGVRYFGDGAWGVDKPRKVRNFSQKWYLEKTVSARHFLSIVLEGDKRTLTSIDPEGKILDQISW